MLRSSLTRGGSTVLRCCIQSLEGASTELQYCKVLGVTALQVAPFSVNSVQRKLVTDNGNFKVHPKYLGGRKQKHRDDRFRKERRDKIMKVELPDFHDTVEDLTPQEIRMKMKQRGIQPMRSWVERPVHLASTPATFEAYVPPEGDGKLSIVTKDGAKQKLELFGKKGANYLSLRKIYRYDEDFDVKDFAHDAQEIYIKAHNALAAEDMDLLHDLVTERAFPIVTHETNRKTIRWQFIESVEPPRSVQVRVHEMIATDNLFAQVTVRLHTKQTLAVYDRFGRLMHGSEAVAKDVLDYVVFEKHIVNSYGTWRMHDKIIPSWSAPRPPVLKTFRQPPPQENTAAAAPDAPAQQEVPPPSAKGTGGPTPAIA